MISECAAWSICPNIIVPDKIQQTVVDILTQFGSDAHRTAKSANDLLALNQFSVWIIIISFIGMGLLMIAGFLFLLRLVNREIKLLKAYVLTTFKDEEDLKRFCQLAELESEFTGETPLLSGLDPSSKEKEG